jgi:hypothetical protein
MKENKISLLVSVGLEAKINSASRTLVLRCYSSKLLYVVERVLCRRSLILYVRTRPQVIPCEIYAGGCFSPLCKNYSTSNRVPVDYSSSSSLTFLCIKVYIPFRDTFVCFFLWKDINRNYTDLLWTKRGVVYALFEYAWIFQLWPSFVIRLLCHFLQFLGCGLVKVINLVYIWLFVRLLHLFPYQFVLR